MLSQNFKDWVTVVEPIVETLSDIVWGPPYPLLILLIGTHIFLSFQLGFVQFKSLPLAFKIIFSKSEHDGDISQFSALMTALASTVGTGNIVGVATAIALGGPGAIFWMWVTGLLGMATKYSEGLLAVKYRQKSKTGMQGGPMYYLANGLGKRWLGCFFAIFTVFAAFGAGNMVQANATANIFISSFSIPKETTGIALALLTGVVMIGGIKSIGRFASFCVPFMIVVYLVTMSIVLGINFDKIPDALGLILSSAFNGTAASGGFIGATLAAAIRFGVSRGLFSNESGLGSGSFSLSVGNS